MPVPQSGQVPFMALRPVFIFTSFSSFISFLPLHLTQYAFTLAPFGHDCVVVSRFFKPHMANTGQFIAECHEKSMTLLFWGTSVTEAAAVVFPRSEDRMALICCYLVIATLQTA